jgi:hypothetical protein
MVLPILRHNACAASTMEAQGMQAATIQARSIPAAESCAGSQSEKHARRHERPVKSNRSGVGSTTAPTLTIELSAR